jgi:hypothetical protein
MRRKCGEADKLSYSIQVCLTGENAYIPTLEQKDADRTRYKMLE